MKFAIVFLVVCCTFSCTERNDILNYTLARSGANRSELEYVLEHYKDSGLKYDAARFLLEHMPECYGADSGSLEVLHPLYIKYDSINQVYGYNVNKEWGKSIDRLDNGYARFYGSIVPTEDLEHIKANYLIKEIDRSFDAWKANVLSRDCTFEDFCEYILPYRRLNGLVMDDVRDTFYHRHIGKFYNRMDKTVQEETDSLLYEYRRLTHSAHSGTSIPILQAKTFEYLQHGLCMHRCWFNSLLLSSLGMPVAIDFVPAWGNRNNSHSWNVIPSNGNSDAFEAFWDNDRWKYKRIYNNRSIDHLWGKFRLPKVYRYTYSNHPAGPVADKDMLWQDIPELFQNVKQKDVSEEYFETQDVTLRLPDSIPDGMRYAYLAVFGYQQWHPVQWGKIQEDGSVTFKRMGKDIVYLPVYYKSGKIIPADSPFKLEQNGNIRKLYDNHECGNVHLRIIRGAPVCDANRLHFNRMRGVRWEGLSNGMPQEELCVWQDSLTLQKSMANLSLRSAYRYIRMYLPDDTVSLGEIEFHTTEGRIPFVKITTDIKTFSPLEHKDMLTDGIDATACQGLVPERYVDFDLGRAYTLTNIGLYPYLESELTEGNFELFFWNDGHWNSAGMKVADSKGYLSFHNIPINTLMMLKNRNKGWEGFSSERTFIYQNGSISWE